MTAAHEEELYLTPEEFLAWEGDMPTKHEYLNGYVQAMAGASRAHVLIVSQIVIELGGQLRNSPCAPLAADMRLRIYHADRTFFYYPDVVVDCSESTLNEVEEPTVIFEVLSPGTRRSDYGEKLINYLNIATLQVYVLVDQQRPHVTVHRRNAGGGWGRELVDGLDSCLELPEIGCTLSLAEVYRRVVFTPAEDVS